MSGVSDREILRALAANGGRVELAALEVAASMPARQPGQETAHALFQKVGKLKARRDALEEQLRIAEEKYEARQAVEAKAQRKKTLKAEFVPKRTNAATADQIADDLVGKLQPGKIFFTFPDKDERLDAVRLVPDNYSEANLPKVRFWRVVDQNGTTTDGQKRVYVQELRADIDYAYDGSAFTWDRMNFAVDQRPNLAKKEGLPLVVLDGRADNVKSWVVWKMSYLLTRNPIGDVQAMPYDSLRELPAGEKSVEIKFTKKRTFEYHDGTKAWETQEYIDKYGDDDDDEEDVEYWYDYPDGDRR
jgi:hypothetical protein